MKALVYTQPNEVQLQERPMPELIAGEVVLKIEAVGICGSDVHMSQADKDGYIYLSNVNEMTEMVEMMAASRSYQNNVEVVNTTRQLMMRTVDMIKS